MVKKNDKVLVLAGKDKGKTGSVLSVSTADKKVVVSGVNIVTKHKKPKSQEDKGGIVKLEAGIDVSNVQVICPVCGKATRVAHKIVDGKKIRVCKKCGAGLDLSRAEAKKAKKDVKAEAKKETKTEAKKDTKAKKTTSKVAKNKE